MKILSLGLVALTLGLSSAAFADAPNALPGEGAVDPYVASNANAGAAPIEGAHVFEAFHGQEGVKRIVEDTVTLSVKDPRLTEIFEKTDLVRLKRTLAEQICYILGGPCQYTGRTMAAAHKDMGLQSPDMNILVEHLQTAMEREHVSFANQNRLLAKLAPMKRTMMER